VDETRRDTTAQRALARKEGALSFVGALTLSVTMFLGLKAIEVIGLRPLRYIESKDAQVVQLLSPRIHEFRLRDEAVVRPIVFIDFDDLTMKSLARAPVNTASGAVPWVPGQSTPRAPIADVLTQVIRTQPAVVLLDFDLRDPQVGEADKLLRKAIERQDAAKEFQSVPVLIPRSLHPFDNAHCDEPSKPGPALLGLDTLIDGATGPGKAFFVHDHFESDSLGYVAGICKTFATTSASRSVSVELPAAAELAASGAHKGDGHAADTKQFQRVQFRVNEEPVYEATFRSNTGKGIRRTLYQRIPARNFFAATQPDLGVLKDAIVIIGATHMGVVDMHPTALGLMPGAVVHANAVMQAQIGAVETASHGAEGVVELLVAIALAAVYGYVYEYRSVMRATGSFSKNAWIRTRNFVQMAILSLLAITAWSFLALSDWVFADVTQFQVVAPIVVVFAELMFEVLKAVQTMVEHAVGHRWPAPQEASVGPMPVESGSES